MRLPERGERGFTLIELLIVVAILGVLAAVVIPNVGRFIGRGETEAAATEFSNIQTAVIAMMTDNELETLPNPVSTATKDMAAFPDDTSDDNDGPDSDTVGDKVKDLDGIEYTFPPGDKPGYVLYQHDMDASDSDNSTLVNYVAMQTTKGEYTCDEHGTVTQVNTGY